jgi:dienelactone hydrolase
MHHPVSAYIAQTPDNSTEHAIILLTDVYGFTFPNTRLLADHFALNGYLTIIPDLFNGNEVPFPPPSGWNLQEYINTKMPRPGTVDPIIEKTVEWLRREKGVSKIGGVGYCFGGKYVCRWLRAPGVGLDAGFTAHPSFVDVEEVQGIQGPLSIAAAGTFPTPLSFACVWSGITVREVSSIGYLANDAIETDAIFTREKRHETEDILAKHTVPYQIFLYSDVEHGFAVKGDLSNAKARFAKEQAFKQAVGWFDEFVKKDV